MKELNKELRIYSNDMSKLTFGQIRRGFYNFSDDERIDSIAVYYDKENDRLVINEKSEVRLYTFCEKGLRNSIESLLIKIPKFKLPSNSEIAQVILEVLKERAIKNKTFALCPSSGFINIGDRIFKTSSIGMVKKLNRTSKAYIIVFTKPYQINEDFISFIDFENAKPVVGIEFSTYTERDIEFDRIKKMLQKSA